MVSTLAFIFMIFTALLTLFGPILIAVIFYRKTHYALRSLFVGMAVFFVSQLVLRIPLIQLVLPQFQWYKDLSTAILPYALFLGFTAGLVEEVGRFIAFKTVLKNHLNWKNAVAYGIGHGGIEAIILIGLTYINNLVISVMINSGLFDTMIAPTLPEGTAETMKDLLINTDASMFLVGGLERIFTFFIHIAFSVLIMVGIKKGKGLLYVIFAILLHMVIDTGAVLLMHNGVNIWIIEAFLGMLMLVSCYYVLGIKKKDVLPTITPGPVST